MIIALNPSIVQFNSDQIMTFPGSTAGEDVEFDLASEATVSAGGQDFDDGIGDHPVDLGTTLSVNHEKC